MIKVEFNDMAFVLLEFDEELEFLTKVKDEDELWHNLEAFTHRVFEQAEFENEYDSCKAYWGKDLKTFAALYFKREAMVAGMKLSDEAKTAAEAKNDSSSIFFHFNDLSQAADCAHAIGNFCNGKRSDLLSLEDGYCLAIHDMKGNDYANLSFALSDFGREMSFDENIGNVSCILLGDAVSKLKEI